MPQAFIIHSLVMGETTIAASVEDRPRVVDLDAKEFRRLEKMGAVRQPTDVEVRLARVLDDADFDADDEDEEDRLSRLDRQSVDDGSQANTVPGNAKGDDKAATEVEKAKQEALAAAGTPAAPNPTVPADAGKTGNKNKPAGGAPSGDDI